MAAIIPIVEGHAEQQSVPVLLRRIRDGLGAYDVDVAQPFRVKRTLVVRKGELERAITQAVRSRPDPGAILVLLDADDDCACRAAAAGPLDRERLARYLY